MAARIEIIFQETKKGMATTTNLDCHKSGHSQTELAVAEELQTVIFEWLENKLHAKKLTTTEQEGSNNVH